ncbi:599_t:CDS:2 [Rhizophagus irregularis]|nr:599_t:CDS:2 [Rhizophagus irregularis]
MSIVLKTILINCQYLEFIKIQYGDDFNDLNELMIYNSEFDFVHSRKLFTLTMILSDDFDNEHYE